MNYYIQGDAANADKIKAAFEAKGISDGGNSFIHGNYLYFSEGGEVDFCGIGGHIANIIKTHPDYKELELPVEPKFKVGDWVVNKNGTPFSNGSHFMQISDIVDDYQIWFTSGTWTNRYSLRLWTIQDAKDGDVITSGKLIVIFNKLEEPAYRQRIVAYVGLDLCGRLQITEDTWQLGVDKAMPATKEQRDLLLAKMKEAGYEWDVDKKELRKIIKPKFKVGDRVIHNGKERTITFMDDKFYDFDGGCAGCRIEKQDELLSPLPKPHYDISNFKPFDKVLARDGNEMNWRAAVFSHLDCGIFVCSAYCWHQCIPYEGNEHLLGTSDMCVEEFINW